MIFDTLENLEIYAGTVPQLLTVAQAMDHDEIYDKAPGHYTTPDPNVTYYVSEYSTATENPMFEFHRNQTFVEIVLAGSELMSTSWRELKDNALTYDRKTDTGFFRGEPLCAVQAEQGRFAVFMPGEPFRTGIAADKSAATTVKKVVFRIRED